MNLNPDRLLRTLPLRLRSIFRRAAVEREMDDELRFHLEHKIEEGIANGLSPQDARLAALRAMDGLDLRREQIRDARRIHWLTDLVDDTRYALRSLRRTSGLAAFVVVTLALGIGMATASFSMVDGLILRPYPVPRSGNVVSIVSTTRDNGYDTFSYREYLDIRRGAKSYDDVIANSNLLPVGFSAEPDATPRVEGAMLVSGNYFRVLGVEPSIGRGFHDAEDEVGGRDAVAVLDPDFWKREFGGDPSVVGRTVRLNGTDFTVIGVAPESFPGLLLFQRPDLYVPLTMVTAFATGHQQTFLEDRGHRELFVRARLKPSVTLQQARSEIAVIAGNFRRDYPVLNRDRGAAVRTHFEIQTRDEAGEWKFIVIFAMLSLTVLAVACTNVAGLLLSRGQTRTREIAVRLAIGAGRSRLIRMLLTECLVLAAAGGVGGVAVAYAGIRFFHTLAVPSELPVVLPFRLDGRVLIASLTLSIASAIVCGLAPALQATRAELVNGLKAADVDAHGRRRLWGRSALVVAQVSLSLVLLAASFLMLRGFRIGVDAGTASVRNRVLMARFDPRLVQYSADQTLQFYTRLADRIRGESGVESAGLTQNPPLGLGTFDRIAFVPDGYTMPRDRESFAAPLDTVDEGFFAAMGVQILQGRAFARSDTAASTRVAIVNEQFARHYWPDASAVGQHLRVDNGAGNGPADRGGPRELLEIVGVAQTVKYRQTFEKPMDFVYVPLAQHPGPRMVLLMRSAGDPHQLIDP
ncbi:MAG TPA: ABC transporter permease, partial [Vicinamibacterales bacterium]|nr:ABC transporter permease [Vicinamibacterales bacterium]